jgi:hypothetical protein
MKHVSVVFLGFMIVARSGLAADLPVSDPLPSGVLTSANQSDDWKIKTP